MILYKSIYGWGDGDDTPGGPINPVAYDGEHGAMKMKMNMGDMNKDMSKQFGGKMNMGQ